MLANRMMMGAAGAGGIPGVWSLGNDMLVDISTSAGFGSPTAGVAAGGNTGGTEYDETEEYDGTSWSYGGLLPDEFSEMAGCGTLTAGVTFGGFT